MRVTRSAADQIQNGRFGACRGDRLGGRNLVISPAFQRGKKTLIPLDFLSIQPSSEFTKMGRIPHIPHPDFEVENLTETQSEVFGMLWHRDGGTVLFPYLAWELAHGCEYAI